MRLSGLARSRRLAGMLVLSHFGCRQAFVVIFAFGNEEFLQWRAFFIKHFFAEDAGGRIGQNLVYDHGRHAAGNHGGFKKYFEKKLDGHCDLI